MNHKLHAPTLTHYGFDAKVRSVEALTPRELEVLSYVAQGHENKAIALLLGIHWMTARDHVYHIIQKLGARNRTQAVTIAYEAGLLMPSQMQSAQLAMALAAHYSALALQLMAQEER